MKRSRLGHGTSLLATASLSLLLGAGAALAQPAQRVGSPAGAEPGRKESPSRAEEVARAQRELDRVSELPRLGAPRRARCLRRSPVHTVA
jgi:hypothetical protein